MAFIATSMLVFWQNFTEMYFLEKFSSKFTAFILMNAPSLNAPTKLLLGKDG